jgi:hypothetical protein
MCPPCKEVGGWGKQGGLLASDLVLLPACTEGRKLEGVTEECGDGEGGFNFLLCKRDIGGYTSCI